MSAERLAERAVLSWGHNPASSAGSDFGQGRIRQDICEAFGIACGTG